MIKVGKYIFDSEEQAETKIKGLGVDTDENGNEYPTHNHKIVKLGHIVLKEGVYELDEKGDVQVIKEPIFSEKYHVDVIWHDLEKHPYGWKTYSVDLQNEGMHQFFGVSYLENKIK